METHLEWQVWLDPNPSSKSLDWASSEGHRWVLNEMSPGVIVDLAPWGHRLRFRATSATLGDHRGVKRHKNAWDGPEIGHPQLYGMQWIYLDLHPASFGGGDSVRAPTYSMLGTDRTIRHFSLRIVPSAEHEEQVRCSASGVVSYTSLRSDFRPETQDDIIQFELSVTSSEYARYEAAIADELLEEIEFTVASVAGFYSPWSPSIHTYQIKVLTEGNQQEVQLPPGVHIQPLRLGHVGESELWFRRRVEVGRASEEPSLETSDIEDNTEATEGETGLTQTDPNPDISLRLLRTVESLRHAAWTIAILLVVIAILILSLM